MNGRVGVVAVAVAAAEAVPVGVQRLVHVPVAVVVAGVAELLGAGEDGGVGVVAVPHAAGDAVAVQVVVAVDHAIAVAVHPVAAVGRPGPHRGVRVVAVPSPFGEPVAVVVHGPRHRRLDVVQTEAVLHLGGEEAHRVRVLVEPDAAEDAAVQPLPLHVDDDAVHEVRAQPGLDRDHALPVDNPEAQGELRLVEDHAELGRAVGAEAHHRQTGAVACGAKGLRQHEEGIRAGEVDAGGGVLLAEHRPRALVLEVHQQAAPRARIGGQQGLVGGGVLHDRRCLGRQGQPQGEGAREEPGRHACPIGGRAPGCSDLASGANDRRILFKKQRAVPMGNTE